MSFVDFIGKNGKIFISWAGFKGSVPIVLATYLMMAGLENLQFMFNLIFLLVIVSVLERFTIK